jgi:hypothetical protein
MQQRQPGLSISKLQRAVIANWLFIHAQVSISADEQAAEAGKSRWNLLPAAESSK